MTILDKALWFINSHAESEISLEAVAKAAGVSRWHMAHAFGEATGHSVMGYVRAIRLSAAARLLAEGAPDILSVALTAGYGSHEAFTRAFRDQFGLTPEQVRAQGQTRTLTLTEPLKMSADAAIVLSTPLIEPRKPMLIGGFAASYTFDTMGALPAQWERFVPHLGHVPGQIGAVAYGVVTNASEKGFDYTCGVEVRDLDALGADYDKLRIPAQTYAIFRRKDHVSKIRAVWSAIWNVWLPASGREIADGPRLERYGEDFNGQTGEGGFEIWLPLKP